VVRPGHVPSRAHRSARPRQSGRQRPNLADHLRRPRARPPAAAHAERSAGAARRALEPSERLGRDAAQQLLVLQVAGGQTRRERASSNGCYVPSCIQTRSLDRRVHVDDGVGSRWIARADDDRVRAGDGRVRITQTATVESGLAWSMQLQNLHARTIARDAIIECF